MIDIIIVKYNYKKLEDQCVKSILENTTGNYHLTIYDNYPENHNLGQLWNRLIENSDADYICLLNSDTIVTEGWLDELMKTFSVVDNVGVVGPSTDHARNHQTQNRTEPYIDYGKEYPDWMLGGFCLIFPKSVWEKAGGFDPNFGFYGQEVGFIYKVQQVGFKQVWCTKSFVYHVGSASAKKAEIAGEFNETEERAKAKELLKDIIKRYK